MYKNVHHITAGAGAGKTTELVNIITRLVGDDADPQRMILTTFTDAAATELREKSKAALSSEKAIKMNGALMGTLHSIAHRYINRYWYLLGISPSVKPISESVSEILMNQSLDDLITGEQKAILNKYAETFGITQPEGGYDYDFWKDTLRKLFDKMRGYGFGKDKIQSFRDETMVLLHNTFNQDGNEELFAQVKPSLKKYLEYKDIVEGYATDAGKKQYPTDCEQIRRILSIDPSKVTQRQLNEVGEMKWGGAVKVAKKGPVKDQYDPELADGKDSIKAAAGLLSQHLVPAEYALILEVTGLMFDILDAWIDAYERIKNENGVIDFADMEELFLRLLKKGEVLEDIRTSVDYLFVDEFQDSTPIQAKIYDILSNQVKQSWFVGDRKQAIYGFAGSDAGLIADLVDHFPKPEKDPTSLSGFKIDTAGNSSQVLDTSRRSTPKLVNAANAVFIEAFKETTGNAKDVIPEEHVRLKWDENKKDTCWDPLYHIQASKTVNGKVYLDAAALATFVCRMADCQEFKDAGYTFSNIAILTRSGTQAKKIGKALIEKDIPTSFVDPKGFKDTPEVSLILAILRLSEGIDREKSRAEIRKLVLDEDLATLSKRVGENKNNLEDFPALEVFAKSLRTHSVPDRISEIITRFDLFGICGQWDNPEARQGSMNLLRKAAEEYADKATVLCADADVRGFISFLKDYKTDQKFDNGAEGVKVLTYHKSKGLDWKIVILCGLDEYKEEDSIGGVSILGPSMNPNGILAIPQLPDKDWVKDCIVRNPESEEILKLRRAVKRGEEKRLLYVGFTRAKEVVITVAINTEPEVIRVLCPTARRTASAPIDDTHVDLWGIPGLVSRYTACVNDETLKYSGAPTPKRYKGVGFWLPASPEKEEEKKEQERIKYHSPSKYKDPVIQAAASVETAKDFGARMDIPHNHLKDNVFGDCIHHIFAKCEPGMHEANLAAAESTLKGYGITETDAPGKVIASIEAFFEWLKEKYGTVTSQEQEVPFQYTDAKGQVFSGNMDLVWRTADGCVLVDYKTFPGKQSDLFNPQSDHWAGKYASQLDIYSETLSASEWGKPLDSLLFYPVEGLVIRCK